MASSGSGSINTNTGTQNNYNNTGDQYNNCTFERTPGLVERRSDWQQIREWLDPPDHTTDHDTARARWEPRTGEWLLQHELYKSWQSGLLWLNGKAGCGKTVLCSTVIEDLKHGVLLYFFFTFSNARKQTLEGMLRSLAAQVAQWRPEPFLQLKEKDASGVHSLNRVLQEVVESLEVAIVLDALDECPEDNRLEVLRWISSQTSRIFVTSRYLQDIADHLGAKPQINIENDNIAADIAIYADSRLTNEPRLATFKPAIKLKIRESVTRRADGMFRWAALLLDEMVKLKWSSDKRIEEALMGFPKRLDEVYERILLECTDHQRVFTLLQWLTYGAETLNLRELVEVLAIDVANDMVDFDDRGDPSDVLRLLSSLVIVMPTSEAVRLAHFTVQEYLESTRILVGPAKSFHLTAKLAHLDITKGCLTYLSQDAVSTAPAQYALTGWADRQWPKHSRMHDQVDLRAEIKFLNTASTRCAWVHRRHGYRESSDYDPWSLEGLPRTSVNPWPAVLYRSAVACASSIGSVTIVEALLAGTPPIATELDQSLRIAVMSGHSAVVQRLLNAGANPNTSSNLDTALDGKKLVIAQMLLDAGADLDAHLRLLAYRRSDFLEGCPSPVYDMIDHEDNAFSSHFQASTDETWLMSNATSLS